MTYGFIVLELLIGLILLFVMTKMLGKTQISQITPFEFVSALVLGELVGNAIYDREVGIAQILVAVIVWGLLLLGIEKMELKFLKLRGLLEGNPSIVVRQGQIDRKELQKNKMTINQLQNLLRQKGVFSMREVEYALLESNGQVAVMKKSEYETPARQDFNLNAQSRKLPITFVIDGKVLEDNLQSSGFNRGWLDKQLEHQGYRGPEDVFYAEWEENQGLYVVPMPVEKTAEKR